MSATSSTSQLETAQEAFNRDFLAARAKLLEVASWLDRVDRCPGIPEDARRLEQIQQGITALQSAQDNRAEQIQQIFSLEFNDSWQSDFGLQ